MKRDRSYCSHHRPPRPEHALSERNLRNVRWYRRTRAWLLAQMGGVCVDCGTIEELEFDELLPRPAGMPRPNKTSRWQRLRNYLKIWREHGAAGLAIRCRRDNAKRGEPPPPLPHGVGESEPF